ncbi:MAG: transposase [Candidatus Aenigmarchaeota archaeon]|nr:transposase [Candidatus Aenigmarchaeota archaeon]
MIITILGRVTINVKVPHDKIILKKYKVIQRGCLVVYVNPQYTSQTCRICNEIGTRTKGFFKCDSCGYSCNADLNASFNIKNRVKPLAITFGLHVNQSIVADSGGICDVFQHCESPSSVAMPTHFSCG